jgi:tetratricopeptide (TPR) repeat protein
MAEIGLHKLRLKLDEAITYADFDLAKEIASCGLRVAQEKELLGEIMFFKAQFFIIEEDYLQAIKYLDKAIQYNQKDGAAYNDRALCMVEMGKKKEALSYFERGIEVESDYATIHHNKGWLLSKMGKLKEAEKCLTQALKLEPKRAVTYENLADVYQKQGKKAQALKAYNNVLKFLRGEYPDIRKQIEKKIKVLEKSK